MKYLQYFCLAILSISVFCSSCKKSNNNLSNNWTCSCSVNPFPFALYTQNVSLNNMSKGTATDSCNAIQASDIYPLYGGSKSVIIGTSTATCQLSN